MTSITSNLSRFASLTANAHGPLPLSLAILLELGQGFVPTPLVMASGKLLLEGTAGLGEAPRDGRRLQAWRDIGSHCIKFYTGCYNGRPSLVGVVFERSTKHPRFAALPPASRHST